MARERQRAGKTPQGPSAAGLPARHDQRCRQYFIEPKHRVRRLLLRFRLGFKRKPIALSLKGSNGVLKKSDKCFVPKNNPHFPGRCWLIIAKYLMARKNVSRRPQDDATPRSKVIVAMLPMQLKKSPWSYRIEDYVVHCIFLFGVVGQRTQIMPIRHRCHAAVHSMGRITIDVAEHAANRKVPPLVPVF